MKISKAALFTCMQLYLQGLQSEMEAADLWEPPHVPIVCVCVWGWGGARLLLSS